MVSGSISLRSPGSFHLSLTVLSTIGRFIVFCLGWWSTRLQAGFHVPRPTLDTDPKNRLFAYEGLTLFASLSQAILLKLFFFMSVLNPGNPKTSGLGSSPSARRYSGNLF